MIRIRMKQEFGTLNNTTDAVLSSSKREFLIGAVVFFVSCAVYLQYGLNGWLARDPAIYMYGGQQMAQGVPPYVSIFDVRGPLTPILPGIGVIIGRFLHMDDLIAVRIFFLVISALTCVSIYLLTKQLIQSERSGLLAAAIFLGFVPFSRRAAAGPDGKTPMILFETLNLYFTSRKKWFWGGVFGAMAGLVWQPMAVFAFVTLAIAAFQPREDRWKAILKSSLGIAFPLVLVSLYFFWFGAFRDFFEGAVTFQFKYMKLEREPILQHLLDPFNVIFLKYRSSIPAILIGIVIILYFYWWRRKESGSIFSMLSQDQFAPFLLSLPFPFLWSFRDFQAYPDFYVFLPYVAVAFGFFLENAIRKIPSPVFTLVICIVFALSAGYQLRLIREETGIQSQRKAAKELDEKYGNKKLMSIGVPEVLVLLKRTNPSKYAFLLRGMDRKIGAETPGGFMGWFQQLEDSGVDVIVIGPMEVDRKRIVMDWLDAHYKREEIWPWKLYVKR